MWDPLYPIIGTLTIGVVLFVFGFGLGAVFLASRMAMAVKAHPLTTRWFFLVLIAFIVFLFFRFIQPLYYAAVVGLSCTTIAWGFLSRIEKRFLWGELLAFSFWFPTGREEHVLAKDET